MIAFIDPVTNITTTSVTGSVGDPLTIIGVDFPFGTYTFTLDPEELNGNQVVATESSSPLGGFIFNGVIPEPSTGLGWHLLYAGTPGKTTTITAPIYLAISAPVGS